MERRKIPHVVGHATAANRDADVVAPAAPRGESTGCARARDLKTLSPDRASRSELATMVRTVCRSALLSIPALVGLLLVAPGDAAAQPPGATIDGSSPPGAAPPQYAPAPQYAPPPYGPPPPVVVVARPPPSFPRWGIGVHLGGLGVTSERDRDDGGDADKTDLGLVGLQLRFRLHRRWELELDVSAMGGELSGPGDTRRTTGAVILGGMFHINPDSRWLWSVLLGVGGARDRIWYEKNGDRVTQAEFAEGLVRLGIGLERRFGSWGLAAQLYGVGLARDEDQLDGPEFVGRDGPVPEKSSGGLFQLVASYYF